MRCSARQMVSIYWHGQQYDALLPHIGLPSRMRVASLADTGMVADKLDLHKTFSAKTGGSIKVRTVSSSIRRNKCIPAICSLSTERTAITTGQALGDVGG